MATMAYGRVSPAYCNIDFKQIKKQRINIDVTAGGRINVNTILF